MCRRSSMVAWILQSRCVHVSGCVVLDSLSKLTDFGFRRSMIRGYRLLDCVFSDCSQIHEHEEEPLSLPKFIHTEDVVWQCRFASPQSALSVQISFIFQNTQCNFNEFTLLRIPFSVLNIELHSLVTYYCYHSLHVIIIDINRFYLNCIAVLLLASISPVSERQLV